MLQVEQVLQERYQLKQKLGQNAGRQTWLAEDLAKQPTEPVIVKLLAFGDQVQWDNLKLFEREANILKQLNHPRIPKYRDYFSIDDRILWFGLAQDYIPGSSLKELLAQGLRFSEAAVRTIAIHVLKILIYLHELSPVVLHRDIKPSNLILGQDKKIHLVDFGAVQDRAATEGATFTVVGTYGYAPMEQFGGRAVPSSDLYALGATLIHLLTGTAPADLPQRNMRIQFSDRVSLSPHFINWIETLAEPYIEQRFSTARQALDTLRTRNISHSSVLRSKPYGSRIQLKKSSSQLEIKIPGRGIQIPTDTDVVKRQDSRQDSNSKAIDVYSTVDKQIKRWLSHIIVNPVDAYTFRKLGVMLYQQNYKSYRDEAIANLKIAYGLFQKKGEKQEAMLTLKLWEMVFRRVNPKMLMTVYPAIDEGSGE
jgi:serine/threonine protein kinase